MVPWRWSWKRHHALLRQLPAFQRRFNRQATLDIRFSMNCPPEMTSVRWQIHSWSVNRARSHQHRTPILPRLHVRILSEEAPERAGLHGRLPFAPPSPEACACTMRASGTGHHQSGGLLLILAQSTPSSRFPGITRRKTPSMQAAQHPPPRARIDPQRIWTGVSPGRHWSYLLKNWRTTKRAFAGRSAMRRVK
jgi:hypothetical protein